MSHLSHRDLNLAVIAALATYLWNEGRIPAERLMITQVELREVDVAARWEE